MKSSYDVVVVGCGAYGSAVAYELAKRSVDVLLIDKQLPGRATSASAGGLWPVGEAVGLGCGVIFHADGSEGPPQLPDVFRHYLVESNLLFPDLHRELLETGGVDFEFERGPGLLFLAYDDGDCGFIKQLADQDIQHPNFRLEPLTPERCAELEPLMTRDIAGAALLHGEHQVNPMLLAEAYKRAAIARGVDWRANLHVDALRREGNRIVGIETAEGFVQANHVVNAAGAWAGKLAKTAQLDLPVGPVRGQVVLTETLPEALGCCISTPRCYIAQKQHGEVLIGSTTEHEGFDVSVTTSAIKNLCAGAIRAIPALRDVRIKRVWSGLRPGTPDELPILGPVAGIDGYVNAAGGFRTGIVSAPLTGVMVAQSIVDETLSFELEPFLAERFAGRAAQAV